MANQTPKNIIDKAIEYVAPQYAWKREKSRMMLALAGGYTGASRSRPALANFNPGVNDADGDTLRHLTMLRARTRDLCRNAPLASGAINTVITNVVGTGLAMKPNIDHLALNLTEDQAEQWKAHVTAEWTMWAESKNCDATLTQNFYELQALAFRSALESGDVLCLMPSIKRGKPYDIAVQLVEADRLCNKDSKPDTAKLIEGVVLDEYGAPTAYQICNIHPNAMLAKKAKSWVEIPAFGAQTGRRNVLHLFERKRPGQTRGVPYLAAVIEPLKQLDRYSEAELQAAVISAAFAIFVKMDAEAFGELFSGDSATTYINNAMNWDGDIKSAGLGSPGKAVNLLPGESVESPALGRPNDKFDPFVLAILRQIGVALELPYEVLIKHFTASYSAARAALLDAWRVFRKRREWLAANFCQPIYETWLEEAILKGRVNAPGYFADASIRHAWSRAIWIGDGPGSIDPEKEVNAAEKRIYLGISTREAESLLHDGVDWESKHRQQVKEKRLRDRDGMADMPPPSPAAANQPRDNSAESGDFEYD